MDTNILNKFADINRMDLVVNATFDNASFTITNRLVTEYQNYGIKFQKTLSNDYSKEESIVMPDNSGSCYSNKSVKFIVKNMDSFTPTITQSMSITDKEIISMGIYDTITLSDDFKHIRKGMERYAQSQRCFGGLDILAINIIKRKLTPQWAGRYCQLWKKKDVRWLPKDFTTFINWWKKMKKNKNYISNLINIFDS